MNSPSPRDRIAESIVAKVRGFAQSWNGFWFTPSDIASLATCRFLTGLVLLYVHTTTLPLCFDAIGPEGWVDAQAWTELAQLEYPYRWSLWSLFSGKPAIALAYGLFLVSILCFAVGFRTRWAAVAVWLGQLSYAQRGFVLCYGLESIAAFLTLYLMIGPCGGAFSVDSWLARRRAAIQRKPVLQHDASVSANIAVRCIQIHICIVYLFAGLAKLKGSLWWSGLATYYAAMSPEMWPFEMNVGWIGRHPQLVQVLANLSVLFTLTFEISFAVLVWNRRLRPLLLASAVALHLGIGFMMGIGAFGSIMLAGCATFVSPDVWRSAATDSIHWLRVVPARIVPFARRNCAKPGASLQPNPRHR